VHFSRLRLTGFKSFVDATEMWIEPGLTGIVGPNGCGKSNLVEALRWVMGETSAKQMRGGGMDDMIFGGTEDRPARNLAEVSLILDNADRTAPARFNDSDEIDVVRRIERDSGSVYRINGSEVRARDVQTMFADIASGARSTALVSQGRIGSLISAKPTERRHLLEEAAGITGLHSRRHEAELRLRAAETNLERLDDLLAALEEQLKALKRQARQATRYRNLSDHIRRAEAIGLHLQWTETMAARSDAAAALARTAEAVAEMTRRVATATTIEAEAAGAVPGLRTDEAEAAAALQRLLLARDALDAEEQRLEAARREIETRLAQIAGDIERENSLQADATQAIARLEAEAAEIREAVAREDADSGAATERLAAANGEVERLEGELTRLTEKIAADEARETASRRRLAELHQRAERIKARREEIAAERSNASEAVAAEGALDDLASRAANARGALDAARAAFDSAEAAHTEARHTEGEAREVFQSSESAISRLRAELDALAELLTVGDPDLWPPMIDAVSVAPGYEIALAAALGDDLDAPADEAAPVHWRITAASDTPPELPSGARPLSDFAEAPPVLARRLAQIGVVADEAAGAALARELHQGQRLVSKTGALWRWDGYTVIGDAVDTAARRMTQRNRLKHLRGQREAAETAFEASRDRFLATREAALSAGGDERTARDAARAALDAWQDARDAEAAQAQQSADARSRIAALNEAAETLGIEETDIAALAREADDELKARPGGDADRDAAQSLRGELARARAQAAECQSAHDRLLRDAAARRERTQAIEAEMESWRGRVETAVGQLGQLEERQRNANDALEQLEARPAEIARQRSALFDQIAAAEETRDRAADALAAAETASSEATRDLRAREAVLAERREDRVRCQAQVEQIDQALTGISERMRERLDCAPEEALDAVGVKDDDKLPDRDAIETRLERLKRERENMGAVNLRADIEATELGERIEIMQTERADLTAAIMRLRQGIAGLNREGRTRLLAAFKEVDTHFRELFARLFGGGRAHLALTAADDPLEAGLEIMASPPGKKLQMMSLLSGGEQALTALALLFAVFMTNPAPICVLDEVDAPLDDANVERFCDLVGDIAGHSATRFLVVTHHRLTMARMDRLFGVTMSERGVSQLVSVDLQAAEGLRKTA
jgi:chromosome segregation protein